MVPRFDLFRNFFLLLPLFLIGNAAAAPPQDDLGRARELLGREDYAEAVKAFRQADKLAGGSCAECQLGLARAFNHLRAFKDAEKSAVAAELLAGEDLQLKLSAIHEQAVAIAAGARKDRELEESVQLLRKALELSNGNFNAARYTLGSVLLRLHRDSEGITTLQEYLNREPQGLYTGAVRALIENPDRARKRLIPEFDAVTLDGSFLSDTDLKGKVVLLDFWGTWCGPCRAAVPSLRNLARRMSKETFVLLSISTDDEEEGLRKFITANDMSWPQVWDRHRELVSKFGVDAYPTYLLVSPEGEVVYAVKGWGEGYERELSFRISNALRTARKGH